jgi:hypothetical protein
MVSSDPAGVADLFRLAASETAAMQDLTGAVDRLRAAQDAKMALARLSPDALRAGLLRRRGGDRP